MEKAKQRTITKLDRLEWESKYKQYFDSESKDNTSSESKGLDGDILLELAQDELKNQSENSN
jgi:hypothetical protein